MTDTLSRYLQAKKFVFSRGFEAEVAWQATRSIHTVTESELLSEAAWVILCSGFRESSVRRVFADISFCFLEWESATAIADVRHLCVGTALRYFNHSQKLNAIAEFAETVAGEGFETLMRRIEKAPLTELRRFAYIGDITSVHLAKNLGFPLAKPDRHLQRMAHTAGFSGAGALCHQIATLSGDGMSVVDVVLWRYAALTSNYDLFAVDASSKNLNPCSHVHLEERGDPGHGEGARRFVRSSSDMKARGLKSIIQGLVLFLEAWGRAIRNVLRLTQPTS